MSEEEISKLSDEQVVRALRDKVYGVPSTDKNWEGCRDNWMKTESIKWLNERCNIKLP